MARFLRVKPIEWHGEIALRVEIHGCMRGEPFITTTHKNYKFLDCDWFRHFYFPLIHLQVVIGQFVIEQFNKPITFKVAIVV